METWTLIGIVVGGTGIWKLLEMLIQYKMNKKRSSAEVLKLTVSSQDSIVNNWVQWSQKLEKRVKEAEDSSTKLKEIIEKQKKQIRCLERKVRDLENRNNELVLSNTK